MVTNKEAIVESDPFLNMKNLEPQFRTHLRAERVTLFVLTLAVCISTGLAIVYTPPFTTFTLFIVYATVFSLFRIYARENRSIDRTATIERESNFDQPFVSIVIPAHNEESVIRATVENIMAMDYPEFELLVVDDRSTDRTPEILKELAASFGGKKMRVYTRNPESTPFKAAALNDAMAQTVGKLIAVFDADAKVAPDFIAKLVPYFANPLVGAVQSKKSLLNANQNFITRCQQYEYGMDFHLQSVRDTIRGAVELRGNGMMLRRTALEELEGFNERVIGEDLDLCTRMHMRNWDLRFATNATVNEEGPTTLGALFKQRVRWTEGSIVRYLENAQEIIFHRKLAFRTKLDAALFMIEFIGPLWLLLENISLAARAATHQLPSPVVIYAAPAMAIFCAYFLYASFVGIKKSENTTVFGAFKGMLAVYVYLTVLWLPIVFYLTFKILTSKDRGLTWYKTPRYGTALAGDAFAASTAFLLVPSVKESSNKTEAKRAKSKRTDSKRARSKSVDDTENNANGVFLIGMNSGETDSIGTDLK